MDLFGSVVSELMKRGFTISAAESCTGGMFCSQIVGVPDASQVLSASFVTYSQEAKQKFVFVKESTVRTFGIVSPQTAVEMATGAAKAANAQVGIGITGYAGPSGGDGFAKKGTVCYGIFINGKTYTYGTFTPEYSRNQIREYAVQFAAEMLLLLLRNEG